MGIIIFKDNMKYAFAIVGLIASGDAQRRGRNRNRWRDRDDVEEIGLGEDCSIPAPVNGIQGKRPRCAGRREWPRTACCAALLKSGEEDTPANRQERCVDPNSNTGPAVVQPAIVGV